MSSPQELARLLRSLDGSGYKAYKRIAGRYAFPAFELRIDHVQGDPFADPSRVRVLIPAAQAGLPEVLLRSAPARTAAADFLNRSFAGGLQQQSQLQGSGKSGELSILEPGQQVLQRTSMLVHEDGRVEARFRVGLPARGRTILGDQAAQLLCDAIPRAVDRSLRPPGLDAQALRLHVDTVEDAIALRSQLAPLGLVAFVADGSILPRRSGIDDRPLPSAQVVPFLSPDSLRVTLHAPHAGKVTGMGIPRGVTLLVGGGFHGKSTLLRAVEKGVYDHVPGDGRERVVSVPGAVKVRAEDGRSIAGTDVSNFIANLPGGQDPSHFLTDNASGSTSQAAAIVEALEVGAQCLLLDEDTSATNLLIRDARIQALIADEDEPITPFLDHVGRLYREQGVSTIMVVGGSGDYLDVADTVIAMRAYQPRNVTLEAREVARTLPTRRRPAAISWGPLRHRIPLPDSIDPRRGHREVEVKAQQAERVRFGAGELELSAVEQLVEAAQTRAIARAIAWGRVRCIDGRRTLPEALLCLMRRLDSEGLDAVDERIVGEYAEFRIFELAAALSRLRSLRVLRADGTATPR